MTLDIEADTLENAIELALKEFFAIPDENYLQDSFEIDEIVIDNYPNEDYDMAKIIQKL